MPFKNKERQRAFHAAWREKNRERVRECDRKRRLRQLEKARLQGKARSKRHRNTIRLKALTLLCGGQPRCERCGCTDWRVLDVHHKNGDGGLERKQSKSGAVFWRKIVSGERATNDLAVACRVCNWAYYIETKVKGQFTINWKAA